MKEGGFSMVRHGFAKVLLTATVLSVFAGAASAEQFARIGTSSVGGGFYLIGNTIAQLGNSLKNGINYTAVTGGSTKNLTSLAKKDIEFGLCQSATIDEAVKGIGAFKAPLKQLRFVTAIYPMPCHVLVHGDTIKNIGEFRGKRIDYGAIGQGIETYCRIILNAYGITDADVKVDRYGKTESTEAIQNGDVDASFWTTTAPNAQVTDMLTKNVFLLPIDDEHRAKILKEHPYFSESVIPGGSYKGYPKDLPTIAAVGVLVTYADMPDDVVYKTVKAMYENIDYLKGRLPSYFASFGPKLALDGCVMEVHPGAMKYFKEAGIVKK